MSSINTLGLKVVGITAIIVVIVFGAYAGVRQLIKKPAPAASPTPAISAEPTIAPDADHDGLPDKFEPLYQTDPNKADTDNDGISDLQEITNGTNPLLVGPNDQIKPPTGQAAADSSTFTGKYLASLPDNISREEILKKERVEAFINLNKGELLPKIAPDQIVSTTTSGKTAIETYLNAISASQNKELAAVTNEDINNALQQQLTNNNSTALIDLAKKLEHNLELLKKVPTPTEVIELQTKYLAASQALLDNVKLLSTMFSGDFVGGLIAAKKIEELGTVFGDIATQIKALETKYGLK